MIDTNFHDCYGLERNGPEYQAVMNAFAKMHPIGRVGQVIFHIVLFCFVSKSIVLFMPPGRRVRKRNCIFGQG